MKFLTLADWTGMVETELFAPTYRSYAAQLGRLEDARDWLDRACKFVHEPAKMKLMAFDDPNLEPLWKNIGGLKA
jgi:hypothetical protein